MSNDDSQEPVSSDDMQPETFVEQVEDVIGEVEIEAVTIENEVRDAVEAVVAQIEKPAKKAKTKAKKELKEETPEPDMLDEYDFSSGVRGSVVPEPPSDGNLNPFHMM